MNKLRIIIILLSGILLFSNCKKKETTSSPCIDCSIGVWVGSFEGTGNYYQELDSSSVMDVPTTITIDSLSETMLKIDVVGDKLFSSSTIVSKTNTDNFIEVAGSSSSLSLTLSQKDGSYRLSGTSKIYHYQADTLLVIDYSLSFDALKLLK